jgi:hypothetical protein
MKTSCHSNAARAHRRLPVTVGAACLMLAVSAAWAEPRASQNYAITTDAADSGGGRAASASYTNSGSAGLIAGIATGGAQTAKHGYLGQLYEITGLAVSPESSDLPEETTVQLAARHTLDDGTEILLDPAEVAWSILYGPLAEVSAAGRVQAGVVYQDTPAAVEVQQGGHSASAVFNVLDVHPDNFGAYAGDGLGDNWQVSFFGLDNPLAAPEVDADGDGHANAFEELANLIPTDPLSRFLLRVEPVAGKPGWKNVIFSPRWESRQYTVRASTTLTAGSFAPLGASNTTDLGNQRTVTDLEATEQAKFYQVEIRRE